MAGLKGEDIPLAARLFAGYITNIDLNIVNAVVLLLECLHSPDDHCEILEGYL
jgi:response regulator RpfG family c-di-GMP phosphodiesterase